MESRACLDDVIALAQGNTGEFPEEAVDQLVSDILGTTNEVRCCRPHPPHSGSCDHLLQLSSSEYGDTEFDDANIEAEVCVWLRTRLELL